MEDKETLEHKKFHIELELMKEEARPKIEASFKRLKRSHYQVMIVGGLMFLFMAAASVVAQVMIPNALVRTIVFTAVFMGTLNQFFELLKHHTDFKSAEKGFKQFEELDLSFESEHKESKEEPKTEAKLKN